MVELIVVAVLVILLARPRTHIVDRHNLIISSNWLPHIMNYQHLRDKFGIFLRKGKRT